MNTKEKTTLEETKIKIDTIAVIAFHETKRLDVTEKTGYWTCYHTTIDGEFVKNSVHHNKEKALEFYKKVITLKGKTETTTIIDTTTVKV